MKKFLNKVLQAELEPIRERRKMWEAKLPEVAEILQQGTKAARAKAQERATALMSMWKDYNHYYTDFSNYILPQITTRVAQIVTGENKTIYLKL